MPIDLNLSSDAYHAIKALSAGMLWTLDTECPRKAWLGSPWNAERVGDTAAHFDIGTAAHLAVLEPHLLSERVELHGFDEYRTKESRDIRDAAYIAGKTPLKPKEWDIVSGVQQAIQRHPLARELFRSGDAEASLTWDWNGVKCKCRPDQLSDDRRVVLDLKTAESVNPRSISKAVENYGWFVRTAWYLAGIEAATGVRPDHYYYVVVEKNAPHIVEIFEVEDGALMQGEQIIMRGMKVFRECMERGVWPTYSGSEPGVIRITRPSWAQFQFADREEAGDFQ